MPLPAQGAADLTFIQNQEDAICSSDMQAIHAESGTAVKNVHQHDAQLMTHWTGQEVHILVTMQHTRDDSRTSNVASTAAGHASWPCRSFSGVKGSYSLGSCSSTLKAACIDICMNLASGHVAGSRTPCLATGCVKGH